MKKDFKHLRISEDVKTILEKLKKKYKADTYDDLILLMVDFFKKNNINPYTKIESNLNDNLLKLKSDFIARDKSMRSFLGRLESEYIKGIDLTLRKLLLLNEEKFKEEVLKDSNKTSVDEPVQPVQDLDNNQIENLQNQIRRLNVIINEKTEEIQESNNRFHSLYKSFQFKKSTFGDGKYVIELTESEYKKLY